jgi:hypothetical protein
MAGSKRKKAPVARATRTTRARSAPGAKKPGSGASRRAAKGRDPKEASQRIDERIRSLDDWRGEVLVEVRRLIREADPEITEECKWVKPTNPAGVPVWSHAGIVCTGEVYKHAVKLTFPRGAALEKRGEGGLFNAGLDGNARRAIDIREGQRLDAAAFKALIRAAVAENLRAGGTPAGKDGKKAGASVGSNQAKKVRLLSGGNPRIAKGDGDAPVQAYIAAIPGWKRGVGEWLDVLIAREAPGVRKAVKWNSPFYGIEGRGWFLSFHVFTKYVKVTFFRGASLRPLPPGASKDKNVRYLDIRETDRPDEAQVADWIRQAAALPGWEPGRGS